MLTQGRIAMELARWESSRDADIVRTECISLENYYKWRPQTLKVLNFPHLHIVIMPVDFFFFFAKFLISEPKFTSEHYKHGCLWNYGISRFYLQVVWVFYYANVLNEEKDK